MRFGITLAALATSFGASSFALASNDNALQLEDIMRMEEFGRAAISPDGKQVTYELVPPYSEINPGLLASAMGRAELSKLFLAQVDGVGRARPMFSQAHDRGYWL